MRALLFISLIVCLTNCGEHNSESKSKATSKKGDTTTFKVLACGLYMDKKGNLAFKTHDFTDQDRYLTDIWYADRTDSINGGLKDMKYVVDTATFKILGTFYFKDKNHVYDFAPMSDGGTIGINWDADVNTFQVLESDFFSKDRKHCYYREIIIKDADVNSFKVLDTSYSQDIAYDKRNYYNGEKKMNVADIKKQNLDSILHRKNGL